MPQFRLAPLSLVLAAALTPIALAEKAPESQPTGDQPEAVETKAVETEAKGESQPEQSKPAQKPRVELAILLDTSGSMTGLINQARTHLWSIVNEFESIKRNGQRPDVYVALYEYGNSRLDEKTGWVRQIVPLTGDLDTISEKLFALTTSGGSEFCGQVIQSAVTELEWSTGPGVLRTVFIAGNEPFTQGPVDFRKACAAAADLGITVSTIHCGAEQTGIDTMWAEGAKLADGSYFHIEQNAVERPINAPQDTRIAELNAELNQTYIPYGNATERSRALGRQSAQDANALKLAPAAIAQRAFTKSSANYRNSHWDLVDAVRLKKVKLEAVPAEQLPEALRSMTLDQRREHVAAQQSRREAIQKEIQQLSAARAKHVAEVRRERVASGEAPASPMLGKAVGEAVREQAVASGFEVRPSR
ncbi:MAG: vWA domain-containing protein [Planctomycetota bacterium]